MGEGVATHHGLVVLHRVAGEPTDDAAGFRQLLGTDLHVDVGVGIGPGPDGHHDLLHGRIAGPLPDAVDGALHLTGPGFHGSQRVGHGQAEVVVTVGGDHVVTGHPFTDGPDALGPLRRGGESDGVGDVQRSCARIHRGLQHVAHEIEVGPRGVLGTELHILGVLAGPTHRRGGLGQHLVRTHLELVFHVGRAGGDEGVDASLGGRLNGLPAPVDVLVGGARQATDGGTLDGRGDGVHSLEVTLAGNGEAGLDVVNPQTGQLLGDLQLLPHVQGDARGLLAVAKGGVEDDHPIGTHLLTHGWYSFPGSPGGALHLVGLSARCDRHPEPLRSVPEKRRTSWPGGRRRFGRTRM